MSRDAMSQLDIELKMFHLGVGTTQAAKTCESDQVKLLLELKADTTLKDWRVFEPRNWKIEKNIFKNDFTTCRSLTLRQDVM